MALRSWSSTPTGSLPRGSFGVIREAGYDAVESNPEVFPRFPMSVLPIPKPRPAVVRAKIPKPRPGPDFPFRWAIRGIRGCRGTGDWIVVGGMENAAASLPYVRNASDPLREFGDFQLTERSGTPCPPRGTPAARSASFSSSPVAGSLLPSGQPESATSPGAARSGCERRPDGLLSSIDPRTDTPASPRGVSRRDSRRTPNGGCSSPGNRTIWSG